MPTAGTVPRRAKPVPSVLRSTSKAALFFSEAVAHVRRTAVGPSAVTMKVASSTGSGLAVVPSVQREKSVMPVLVTVFGPAVVPRCGIQGVPPLTDLNIASLASGMVLSS